MTDVQLDLAALARVVRQAQDTVVISVAAEILVSPADMSKFALATDPTPTEIYQGIPIRVHPMLQEGSWVALDSKGRLVMVNGKRVDPGPDILGKFYLDGPPWSPRL